MIHLKKKAAKITILASLVILLASSIVVGATYSLWSSKTTIETHLTSGNLKLKLERTKLTKCKLAEGTGYLVTSNDDVIKDFTNTTQATDNIFDIESGELVVPGSYYEATLKLSNVGTVAFDYTVSLKVTDEDVAELAKQINVYFDDVDKGYLYTDSNNGEFEIKQGSMSKEDTAVIFKVKVEFKDLDTNNEAMDQSVKFDLKVNATQKIAK